MLYTSDIALGISDKNITFSKQKKNEIRDRVRA